MANNRRTAKRTTASDGTPIVLVPLATGQTAIIDADDFDRFIGHGITTQWTFNASRRGGPSYVRCGHNETTGQLLTVARLVMEAPEGRVVTYRDGNRLNLRRNNLRLVRGYARKARERDAMEAARACDYWTEKLAQPG